MDFKEVNIQHFVDQYFIKNNTPEVQHQCIQNTQHTRHPCEICLKIQKLSEARESENLYLNQNDIELLELMHPNTTPEKYLQSIMQLYKKEENLKPREDRNQPMQKALSTRHFFPSSMFRHQDCHPTQDQLSNMQQLQRDKEYQQHLSRLQDECYLGLGKQILIRSETKHKVELTKSNYHTRQYLLPYVREEICRLERESEAQKLEKYYLIANSNPNSTNMSFEVEKIPPRLAAVLPAERYREVVCTLNQIIQHTVYAHKQRAVADRKTTPVFIWLSLVLLGLITLLLLNGLALQFVGLQTACLVVSLGLMLLILMLSCHRFHEEPCYRPLIDQVGNNIDEYLSYLNSRPGSTLYWKTAEHLYWVEVTLLRPKVVHKTIQRKFSSVV